MAFWDCKHHNKCENKIYRISAVLKVETDIITSIVASLKRWAVILVIIYVDNLQN